MEKLKNISSRYRYKELDWVIARSVYDGGIDNMYKL